jgi:hypothetical protein
MAARLSMVSSSDSPLLVDDLDVQVDDVGRQALGGDLERGAGAGRVLEEQVEHALPRISGTFLTSRSEMPTKDEAVSRM